ncbi:hypothetical protein [Priestia filamentosa]|uniref:Uncharacterized protein n=1 Tax=Priestia filamentosa TaxID=1402861 RepID=A0A1X7DH87_9BACI|nr:hypothetical protein [Priestia filamentosa]AKO93436.1 hypothetical protein BEH_15980 [Priestia filamentosa]MDT3763627.1 hypothetical protein [Priestia filamentosa]OXS71879.1 hypothetical protein B1B01_06050 [Priestia filamentosa]RJS63259.1 hypothetical protein CJ485_00385 [Priestia filamentosa]WCM14276.1 hypothetical protein PGN40_13045 [Priestia filamentosa]
MVMQLFASVIILILAAWLIVHLLDDGKNEEIHLTPKRLFRFLLALIILAVTVTMVVSLLVM